MKFDVFLFILNLLNLGPTVKLCSRFVTKYITFRAASDRVRFSSWREIGAGNGALCALTMDSPVGPELQNQLLCPGGDVARAVVLTEPGEQVHEHQPSTRGHWW